MGLRYERQTNISSNYNFAPRLFFAWAPGGTSVGAGPGAPPSSSPKMVIRGGMGVFYDRFGERATLLATRFNGVNQQDFRVFNPTALDLSTFSLNGVTNVPTVETLAAFAAPQIVRRIAPDFQAPTFVMTAINFERQLPSKFTFFAVAIQLSRQASAACAQHQRSLARNLRSGKSEHCHSPARKCWRHLLLRIEREL